MFHRVLGELITDHPVHEVVDTIKPAPPVTAFPSATLARRLLVMASWVPALLLLALIVFMLWFALGTQRNIRKGNDVLAWLQQGLPLLGERTKMRWLGSSAVELTITEASNPFSSAEVLIVLEPRDLGWLWAFARSRGRRDFLIFRGRLRKGPAFELEAGDAAGWTGRDGLEKLDWAAWREAEWGLPNVRAAHSADADPDVGRRFWESFSAAGRAVWRLSVRRDAPNVQVHVVLPDIASARSDELVRTFVELGRAATLSR